MNLGLWIAAGLLAAVALVGGITKTFVPKEKLSVHEGGQWTAEVEPSWVRERPGFRPPRPVGRWCHYT